jgi:hypothetical protein
MSPSFVTRNNNTNNKHVLLRQNKLLGFGSLVWSVVTVCAPASCSKHKIYSVPPRSATASMGSVPAIKERPVQKLAAGPCLAFHEPPSTHVILFYFKKNGNEHWELVSWARNENLAYFAKRTRVEHVLAEMCMVSLLNMDIWCKLHKEASGIILLGFIKICGIDLHVFAGVCTLLFLYLEYLIPWSIINNYYLGVQLSSVFMPELVLNVDYGTTWLFELHKLSFFRYGHLQVNLTCSFSRSR